RFPSTHRANIG
ncbi:hypothetical protein KGF57_000462, partial [Candida theae]